MIQHSQTITAVTKITSIWNQTPPSRIAPMPTMPMAIPDQTRAERSPHLPGITGGGTGTGLRP
jgi:hypothetical protein